MHHTDPIYTFLVILALVFLWVLNRYLNALKKKLDSNIGFGTAKPDIETLPKAPKKIIEKRNSIENKNERNNFEKAYLKARRQGHIRFFWHDEAYYTGNEKIDGTGK